MAAASAQLRRGPGGPSGDCLRPAQIDMGRFTMPAHGFGYRLCCDPNAVAAQLRPMDPDIRLSSAGSLGAEPAHGSGYRLWAVQHRASRLGLGPGGLSRRRHGTAASCQGRHGTAAVRWNKQECYSVSGRYKCKAAGYPTIPPAPVWTALVVARETDSRIADSHSGL